MFLSNVIFFIACLCVSVAQVTLLRVLIGVDWKAPMAHRENTVSYRKWHIREQWADKEHGVEMQTTGWECTVQGT